jgi:hypothetical protein
MICITFLREPIERIISYHNHVLTNIYTNNWIIANFIIKRDLEIILNDNYVKNV